MAFLDSLDPSAKARAFAVPITLITGSAPLIRDYPSYSTIDFNPQQKKIIRGFIAEQLSPSKPRAGVPKKRGETGVKINVNSVLLPEVAKQYWYYIAALIGIGYALGAGSAGIYYARRP
jgi:hypothetical protein